MRAGRKDAPQGGHRPYDGGEFLAFECAKETGQAFLGLSARARECLCSFGGDLQGHAAPVTE
jgi:hypothetical protein